MGGQRNENSRSASVNVPTTALSRGGQSSTAPSAKPRRYKQPAYPTISPLGTETPEAKGEKPRTSTIGDRISEADRFQDTSLGRSRLETMPTFTASFSTLSSS